ncbi:MAG: hypothetical protein ACOCQQ_00740 [Candidatus Nanoarchaeia archaeon]
MNPTTYYSDITGQSYSANEFLHMLEKRVRKHLRVTLKFNPKQAYIVYQKNEVASHLLKYLFSSLFQSRLDILFIDSSAGISKEKYQNRIVISDDILETFLAKKIRVFFQQQKIEPILKTVIAPVQCVSILELNNYAKIKHLSKVSLPQTSEQDFISFVQDKYPQTKSSMLKTFLFLEE